MEILDFNTEQGIYHFQVDRLESSLHAHPVFEFILTKDGHFSLENEEVSISNLQFAIIPSNIPHKIHSDSAAQLLLIKAHNTRLIHYLQSQGIELGNGIFRDEDSGEYGELLSEVKAFARETDLHATPDMRINSCLEILEKREVSYDGMSKELSAEVHLSESRLSHLFKEYVGISMKKYLIWIRLQKAISYLLAENRGLTEAGFQSGFYDQAHFSKAFKQMLGMSPSKAYNSRSVQFFGKKTP